MKLQLAPLAIALICGASSAQASIEIKDSVYLTRGPGSVGGVFYVDDLNDGPGVDFGTFCVEITEHIHLGSNYRYYVYNLSNTNHNNGGKPTLTLGTFAAWLYTQYRDPEAAYPITISTTQNAKANAMQLGIWRSMGYTDSAIAGVVNWNLASLTSTYLTGWLTNFQLDTHWTSHGPNYTGGVQIMSLATSLNSDGTPKPGSLAQDQLVWEPLPDPVVEPVPEPASILVWASLVGAGAFVWVKRC